TPPGRHPPQPRFTEGGTPGAGGGRARPPGDAGVAFDAAERAARMNAYDPGTRELAASCAIEAGRFDDARRHILALTILEPAQPRHARRLEAIDRLIRSR
ncbi:MAG: hypothetical protein VX726_07065, partial [Planctomycetota bacterium]|nr:hypothetical protein [Planctomycetota bacterium]